MKYFIIILTMISTLIAGKLKEPIIISYAQPEQTIGRYQIFVTEVTSVKTGQQYLVETIFDTRNGKVLSRTKFLFYKTFNEVLGTTFAQSVQWLEENFPELNVRERLSKLNKSVYFAKKDKDVFETIGIPVKKGVCK